VKFISHKKEQKALHCSSSDLALAAMHPVDPVPVPGAVE